MKKIIALLVALVLTLSLTAAFADGIKSHPDAKCFYAALMRTSDKSILDRPFDRQRLLRANYIDMGVYCHHRDLIDEFGAFDRRSGFPG